MANEITFTAKLEYTSALGVVRSKPVLNLAITQTGTHSIHHTQEAGVGVEEALVLGSVTAPFWCFMENMDSTDYVSVRRATGEGNMVKIPAGTAALFLCEAAAPYLLANSSNVIVDYILIDA